MRTRLLVASVLVCLVSAVLVATQSRGELVGKVVDHTGAVLPGVSVVLTGPDRRTATTNERGEFTFVALLPGQYVLVAELPGFTSARAHVTIVTGGTARLTLQMSVGTLSETV